MRLKWQQFFSGETVFNGLRLWFNKSIFWKPLKEKRQRLK
jgi:hypothetical protein